VLEFVRAKGDLTDAEKSSIASNFPITTLDRLISNPAVRQKVGIQITDGEFYVTYSSEQVIKPLKRIVLDLATKKINVSSVKTKEQQISYIDGLPKTALPSGAKLKAPLKLTSVLAPSPSPTPTASRVPATRTGRYI
jgi:hypothetical protein